MSDLLAHLHIEGSLLIAQVVNFLILLFVLGKFVYKPVMAMLEKRRLSIQEAADKSDAIAKQFEESQQLRAQTLQKARDEAQGILEEAKIRATQQHEELMKKAYEEVESLVARARKEIQAEKQDAMKSAQEEFSALLMPALARVIQEASDEKTQHAFLERAEERVKELYPTSF